MILHLVECVVLILVGWFLHAQWMRRPWRSSPKVKAQSDDRLDQIASSLADVEVTNCGYVETADVHWLLVELIATRYERDAYQQRIEYAVQNRGTS